MYPTFRRKLIQFYGFKWKRVYICKDKDSFPELRAINNDQKGKIIKLIKRVYTWRTFCSNPYYTVNTSYMLKEADKDNDCV